MPMPLSPPDRNGTVWPDASFLDQDHQGQPRWVKIKAYGQRLAEANPQIKAVSPNDRLLVGVFLAAHNARVVLRHRLGSNGPDVSVWGRNHRHGSIFDVEWACGTGQVVTRADLVAILEPFIEPMDPRASSLPSDAFRMTFGGVNKLFFMERTPSLESRVQHEQTLLAQTFDESATHDRQPTVASPRHRL